MNGMTNIKRTIVLVALCALTACGSGSGGGTSLSTGTFFKAYGTNDNGFGAYPFSDTQDAKIQQLYTAAEISGSGNLTALRFRRDSDTGQVSCPNTTIRLGHTNLTTLNATFASNVERGQGSLLTVLDNTAVTISAGAAGEWFDIQLTTPFAYNGVDNLVVEMEQFTVCSAQVRMDVSFLVTDRSVTATAIDTTPGTADHNQTTGTVTSALYWMQFVFAGGDNKMDYASVTAGAVPFATFSDERHGQMLHQAASINGSGPITGIAMISDNVSTVQTYTVNIKLGHTSLSELTDTFSDNYDVGSPVTVATALTFAVPAGIPAGSPIWIPITGSFNYNGTDNLIVDIEVTSSTGGTGWARNDDANHRLYASVGAAMGALINGGSHTIFRFNGGTMDVGLPGSTGVNLVFDDTVDGAATQNLYRPVDLGTGGLIEGIGVRLANDSVAAVHSNYTIRMGHTSNTVLNPLFTFASNMDEDMTVYSGSFSILAGLKAGDWITIPLGTAFNYDATRNLVILFSTLGGAASGNDVQITGGLRYSSSVSGSSAGSDIAPTLGAQNGVVVTRLHIQK